MFDDPKGIDFSTRDIELIEAALHTQEKILTVQRHAGGADADRRLAELSLLTRRLGRLRRARSARCNWSLLQFMRTFFRSGTRCPQNG